MILQSIFKHIKSAAASCLLLALTSVSISSVSHAQNAENSSLFYVWPTVPSVYHPVTLRLDSIDTAIRRGAAISLRAARAKAEAKKAEAQNVKIVTDEETGEQIMVVPYIVHTPGDSIRISENLAIHPADTLDLTPERYYDIYEPPYFTPLIFNSYEYMPAISLAAPDIFDLYLQNGTDPFRDFAAERGRNRYSTRLDDLLWSKRLMARTRQNYMVSNPDKVKYNIAQMIAPPEDYRSSVEAKASNIKMEEMKFDNAKNDAIEGVKKKEIHWLRTFQSSIQFSQAYISPNWYQGGQKNVNAILSVLYNIRLNEKFHPNLLFDTTIQYKLGVNSAPNDTVHSYNITEDLLQAYTKFGLKAANNWYYSVNALFKTQVTKSYPANSRNLKSAFMSPGEVNVGVGMTYSKTTPRLTFNASIAPLSYNLKTCLNEDLNPASFGIDNGKKTKSSYGSNTELTFNWKWSYNISYRSRIFLFTNYKYVQGDWENTLQFNVNRFLSTQFYWHLRYDTQTKRLPDSSWHRFQFKEIFSFGLSYTFKNV